MAERANSVCYFVPVSGLGQKQKVVILEVASALGQEQTFRTR